MGRLMAPEERPRERVRSPPDLVVPRWVRKKAVREVMLAAVGLRIRVECALEQAQPQRVLEGTVAVLAIRQQGHATAGIGQVDPALGGHLERRGFPARVPM